MDREQLQNQAEQIESFRKECNSQADENSRSIWTPEQLEKMEAMLGEYEANKQHILTNERAQEVMDSREREEEQRQRSRGVNHAVQNNSNNMAHGGMTDSIFGEGHDMQEFVNWVSSGNLRSGQFSPEFHLYMPDLREPLNKDSVYNRSLTTGAASGGAAVPGESVAPLLPALYHADPVRASGARVISTPTGVDYKIPIIRRPTANSAARSVPIVTEGSTGAEWDPTFSSLTLGAHSYRGYLDVTRELMQDNGAGLMAELPGFIIQSIVSSRGYDHVKGSGTGQPSGINNVTVSGDYLTTTGNSGGPEWDEIFDFYMSMPGAYRPNSVIHMSRTAIANMMGLVASGDGTHNYNTVPNLSLIHISEPTRPY